MIKKAESPRPLGEARRARYLLLICKELSASPASQDVDFFLDRIVMVCKPMSLLLKSYVRETGILGSIPVARNYVSFCSWLQLLQTDGRFVVPNGYTVYAGNIDSRSDFFLTNSEKVGFFLLSIEKPEVWSLLKDLTPLNRIKQYTDSVSEHYVETFFEWFIDLGILKSSAKKFGRFALTGIGNRLVESLKSNESHESVGGRYASLVLGEEVSVNASFTDQELESMLNASIGKLARFTRSELDPSLHSALPLLLDVRLMGVIELKRLVNLGDLISHLTRLPSKNQLLLNWDPMTSRGYIKIGK